MSHNNDHSLRSALLVELARMKKLGFLVVDDAFEVAQTADLASCSALPLTAVACVVCERGLALHQSRWNAEALH